jgi:uncharacterized protein YyaL (SSP411 family)
MKNKSRMTKLPKLAALLLVPALSVLPLQTAQANYKAKAEEAMNFIQSNFYDADAKLYHAATPPDPKALPYDFMWANGVQFTALVGAAHENPEKYRPLLVAFAEGLKKYWDVNAPVPGFDAYFSSPTSDDKYYDDNAWLVLGFVEAYEDTKEPMFLDWARRTQKFVLSGWDEQLGGGIYWRPDKKSKNTCSNAPAAAAAMRLYQQGQKEDADQLQWAQRICQWTNSHLQDTDGLFWDNINREGKIERTKWTYNTALMIRANTLLYQSTKKKEYLTEARRSADAGLKKWVAADGAIADSARFSHLFSESLLRLYDVTHDKNYLNAVRRHADYGWRYVRDPRGGYWNDWKKKTHAPGERKLLIENASTARLFWLLAPYPDVEELRADGEKAAAQGDWRQAASLFREALDSTADTPR